MPRFDPRCPPVDATLDTSHPLISSANALSSQASKERSKRRELAAASRDPVGSSVTAIG